MAKHRDRLFDMLESGELDAFTLARDLMGYMSDDECADFAHKNDIELFPEEEETEDFEFSDEEEVREAFNEAWSERLAEVPAYKDDKPAKRMFFSCFVDDLERSGRISEELAQDVTMGDED